MFIGDGQYSPPVLPAVNLVLCFQWLPEPPPANVLLIHAGGYSQRLPHVSVAGKIFMAMPCGKLVMELLSTITLTQLLGKYM